jgi:O-antigen/teichoic acid export membrane protein
MDTVGQNNIQQQPVTKKIIQNTLYNSLGVICISIFSLLLTPIIIRYVGVERFGVWAIANVLVAYLGLLDFSMSNPVVKYASEYNALKDEIQLNQLVNTGFVFYSVLAAGILIIGLLSANVITGFFALPAALFPEALFVIKIAMLSFACFILFNIFTSVLVGLQRMDISNAILMGNSAVNFIATIIVLRAGYGLKGLILVNLLVTIVAGIFTSFTVFKIFTALTFNPFAFNKQTFKKLFGFGLQLHLGKLAFLISFQMDKILLGRFLSINAVAFYELGSKITFTMRRLSLLLVSAMVPVASEISVSRDRSAFNDFYLRSSRYLILISIPFFLFGIWNAGWILTAWLGRTYDESIWVIRILGFGYLVNVLTGVASISTIGIGKPRIEMKYSLLVAPLNVFLSILFILKFGVIGAACATAISLGIGAVYYFKIFHMVLDKPLNEIASAVFKAFIVSLFANLLLFPINYLATYMGGLPLRVSSIIILSIKGILLCLIYFKLIVRVSFFDKQDLDFIRQRFAFMRPFIHP